MKKITLQEFDKLELKSRCVPSEIVLFSKELEVGEAFIIEKGEWKNKNAPASTCFQTKRSFKKFSVRTLADGSGWAVVRIK